MLSEHCFAYRFWRLPVFVFAGVFFFIASLKGFEGPKNQDTGMKPMCVSYCSTTAPGTSVMEIKWPISQTALGLRELRSRVAQQTVEVTVYYDGFDRGLFAILPKVSSKGKFLQYRQRGVAAPTIPGLSKLVVTNIATSRDTKQSQPMRLLSTTASSGPEAIVIRVEGLEPGLNYHWRVPDLAGGRKIITCQGSTCPVDLKK